MKQLLENQSLSVYKSVLTGLFFIACKQAYQQNIKHL